MKYLSALIFIFSLAFVLPAWSEESDAGFNFEEMENLNVLLCTDETNKNNKKAFAISKNKDGTFDVFSDNFGLIKLTEVEKDLILNIPQEATMLLFNKRFTDISGLLAGESFKADCFDITAEIALSTEYFSTGAMTEITRLKDKIAKIQLQNRDNLVSFHDFYKDKLNDREVELIQVKAKLRQASSRIERLVDFKTKLSSDLKRSQAELQDLKVERRELVTKKYHLLDEVKNLKEDNSNYLTRLNKQVSKILNLKQIVDEKSALLMDSQKKLMEEESKFKNASDEIDNLLDLSSASDEKLRLKKEELVNLKTESEIQTSLFEEQVATLRKQLGSLQNLLDVAKEQELEVKLQLETFGSDLNIALAKLARNEKEKANIEEERAYIEKEKAKIEREKDKLKIDNAILLDQQAKLLRERNTRLEHFKSEFFGQIRKLIEAEDGVNISGDRFVFSSEILFASGDVELSLGGKEQIKKIANLISSISDRISTDVDWILRVDGHTDDKPIRGGKYSNNWELSQARALSVVFYMQEFLNIPAYRLAATGFGEYQPILRDNSEEARALNRRIEIVLTER